MLFDILDILDKKKALLIAEIKKAFEDVSKKDTGTGSAIFTLEDIFEGEQYDIYERCDSIDCSFVVSSVSRKYKFFLSLMFEVSYVDDENGMPDVKIEAIQVCLVPLVCPEEEHLLSVGRTKGEYIFLDTCESFFVVQSEEMLSVSKFAESISKILASDFANDFSMCEYFIESFSEMSYQEFEIIDLVDTNGEGFQKFLQVCGGLDVKVFLDNLSNYFENVPKYHRSFIEMCEEDI